MIDQLTMASTVRWYGHVSQKVDGYVSGMVLDCEVEVQSKKVWLKRTWKKHVEDKIMAVGLSVEDVLSQSKWIICINLIGKFSLLIKVDYLH